MEPFIYILLPIHNRKETTRQFIDCLRVQTYKNFSLVVIDDGSDDGSIEMIREFFPDAVHIRGNGNWWWAGSLQQGFRWLKKNASENDMVLIMNDDSHIEKDYLQTGAGILFQNPRTLLLSEAYSMQTKKLIDKGVVFDFASYSHHMPLPGETVNCMSTRGLFLLTGDLFKLNGFRDKLLPHYYSDYEFTIRAARKGFKLMVSENLKLWMNELSTGTGIIKCTGRADFFRQYFSKKYTGNPIYTMNFILLAFPFPYKIKFAWRHFISSLKTIIKVILKNPATK